MGQSEGIGLLAVLPSTTRTMRRVLARTQQTTARQVYADCGMRAARPTSVSSCDKVTHW